MSNILFEIESEPKSLQTIPQQEIVRQQIVPEYKSEPKKNGILSSISDFFYNAYISFINLFKSKKVIQEEKQQIKSKITNYQTINKSDRDVEKDFKQNQLNQEFNKEFEAAEIRLPHQRNIFQIIKRSFSLLYDILEMLVNGENPYYYIFSSPDNHFHFATLILLIGLIIFAIYKIYNLNFGVIETPLQVPIKK